VDTTLADCVVSFSPKASVCKYVVPEGYPDNPRKGDGLLLPAELPEGVTTYLSAVDIKNGELIATGSRTLAVVGTAATIAEAEVVCEQVIRQIPGPFFHRADIGTVPSIARRVKHMKAVRSA
jgi:phosphoribosylamine-glycine ligase